MATTTIACDGIEADLPTLFIVSEVVLRQRDAEGRAAEFAAERATGVKCDRCWRYVPGVSTATRRAKDSASAASRRSGARSRS